MPKLETPDDAAPQPPTSRKIPLPRNPRTPEEINAFFPPPSDAAVTRPVPVLARVSYSYLSLATCHASVTCH